MLPFPTRKVTKDPAEKKFQRFVKMLQGLNVSIPFTEALHEMPSYVRFLKDNLGKKRSLSEIAEECNRLELPQKRADPGKFSIAIGLGQFKFNALVDLGASVSMMPLTIWHKVKIGPLEPVDARLYMANNTVVIPTGIVTDVPVQVGKFFVPADFLVVDIAEDPACPIILGRPFLATVDANISVKKGLLSLTISDEVIEYSFNKTVQSHGPMEIKAIKEAQVEEVEAILNEGAQQDIEIDPGKSISTTNVQDSVTGHKYGVDGGKEEASKSGSRVDIDHTLSKSTTISAEKRGEETSISTSEGRNRPDHIESKLPKSTDPTGVQQGSISTSAHRHRPEPQTEKKVSQGTDSSCSITIKDLSLFGRGVPWHVRLCRISDDSSSQYEIGDKVYVAKSKDHWFPTRFKDKNLGPFTVNQINPGGMQLRDKKGVIFEAQATWALQMPP